MPAFNVWVTTVTAEAADALVVALVRRGMTVAAMPGGSTGLTARGPYATLCAMQITVGQAGGRRADDFAGWMLQQVQQALMQARASYHSIIATYQGQAGLITSWAGPNINTADQAILERSIVEEPQVQSTETQPSTAPQPANQLDKMDAAIGAPDK